MALTIDHRVFDPPEDSPVQRFSRSLVPQGKRVKDQTFAFDRVFDDNTTQADVYEATTRSLLDSVLDGYNATVFAYGATGCGKTHTITYVFVVLCLFNVLQLIIAVARHSNQASFSLQCRSYSRKYRNCKRIR
jgi:hypothetical protein